MFDVFTPSRLRAGLTAVAFAAVAGAAAAQTALSADERQAAAQTVETSCRAILDRMVVVSTDPFAVAELSELAASWRSLNCGAALDVASR